MVQKPGSFHLLQLSTPEPLPLTILAELASYSNKSSTTLKTIRTITIMLLTTLSHSVAADKECSIRGHREQEERQIVRERQMGGG